MTSTFLYLFAGVFIICVIIHTVLDVIMFTDNKKSSALVDSVAASAKQLSVRDETIRDQKRIIDALTAKMNSYYAQCCDLKEENERLKKEAEVNNSQKQKSDE